ncbi:MAG: hypothetical protein IJC93_00680 [Clostridia bacterium]|nr:hypothetical protein [Clostridia bacterium]
MKHFLSRFAALILALTTTLSLAACGSKREIDTSRTEPYRTFEALFAAYAETHMDDIANPAMFSLDVAHSLQENPQWFAANDHFNKDLRLFAADAHLSTHVSDSGSRMIEVTFSYGSQKANFASVQSFCEVIIAAYPADQIRITDSLFSLETVPVDEFSEFDSDDQVSFLWRENMENGDGVSLSFSCFIGSTGSYITFYAELFPAELLESFES